MFKKSILFLSYTLLSCAGVFAQINNGQIHGNFQMDAQYYNEDTLIGAPEVPEAMLMNGFGNVIYTNGGFSTGIRYETYLNRLQGFPDGYQGSGITYKYATYNAGDLEVTLGNYYEQFGSGLIFRSYEERNLGLDNAMEGVRLKYKIHDGVNAKLVYGRQRLFFDIGEGIVRGADIDIQLNELFSKFKDKKTKLGFGIGAISKYQKDNDPIYVLPENVTSTSARFNLSRGNINITGEYAFKFNDPSTDNGFAYNNGQAFLLNATYSMRGFALSGGIKSVDNFSFRSDRSQTLTNLFINYMPALNKQHTYNLVATLYPYATQPVGEFAYQGELLYKIEKGSFLGGKYGTNLSLNYSVAMAPNNTKRADTDSTRINYSNDILTPGKEVYYKDFNAEIKHKFSKRVKGAVSYYNLVYNNSVLLGVVESSDQFKVKDKLYTDIFVADFSFKLKPKHTIRIEAQHLSTNQHRENWATGLIEYTISPHYFFALLDQYNYGNADSKQRIHYFTASMGYIKDSNRFSVSYGRQRAGIFCVGGVCRNVPASNGVTLSITSSF
ncbi:MAG: hypothetical protein ACJAUV_001226 [Flavobacteriales bacterium]|jgi:hypothetical protein